MTYPVFNDSLNLNTPSKILFIAVIISALFFTGCKKSHDPAPAPSVTSFSPASGSAGALVTINGLNFSPTLEKNTVTFNGAVAELKQASATQITAVVPEGATTGKIEVM